MNPAFGVSGNIPSTEMCPEMHAIAKPTNIPKHLLGTDENNIHSLCCCSEKLGFWFDKLELLWCFADWNVSG